jgi:hypothetical protein
MKFLYVGKFLLYIFVYSLLHQLMRPVLPSGGLHYVLIYVSYNEILPLLHLFYSCGNTSLTSAVKDFSWPS